jgi:hypothetical protein
MTITVTIEAENPATRATTFRVSVNGILVAAGLRASEAHLVVGKALQRIALPRKLRLPKTGSVSADGAERAA